VAVLCLYRDDQMHGSDMKLFCAIIAKHADLGQDNLVSMMGGCITAIRAPILPFGAPLALVVRIRVEPSECDQDHQFRVIRIVGPDGSPVGQESPPVSFRSTMDPGARYGSFTCIIQAAVPFAVAGVYRFVFDVDGTEIGDLELDVLAPQNETGVVP